ncbi:MAG: molecular chaperone DnaJ [Alphaproteobacteria bacterium]|nr:molecular chaperone DnaJ [Alphaproteobacteria bacterium]MBU2378463.1 molecular chaperone DnaJ [Alphaproteobacteria bacterium]
MGLIWLVLVGIGVWALVRLGRQTEGPRRGQWRVAATLISAALLAGGALALVKGTWIVGGALIGAGLWMVLSSRVRAVPARRETLGDIEARSILGVPVDASPEDINAAWRRLMGRAHPDQGGTEGLAARLNAARDRLLKN